MTQAYEMYLKQMAALYQRWMTGEQLTARQTSMLTEYVQDRADEMRTDSVCFSGEQGQQSSAFAYDQ